MPIYYGERGTAVCYRMKLFLLLFLFLSVHLLYTNSGRQALAGNYDSNDTYNNGNYVNNHSNNTHIDPNDYSDFDNVVKAYNNLTYDKSNDRFSNSNNNNQENIFVFISFSMPDKMLKDYINEARYLKEKNNTNITFVLRGFHKNSFRSTVFKVNQLSENKYVSIITDPTLFQKYNITQVPVILKEYTNTGTNTNTIIGNNTNINTNTNINSIVNVDTNENINRYVNTGTNTNINVNTNEYTNNTNNQNAFDKIGGSVSLKYALEKFREDR